MKKEELKNEELKLVSGGIEYNKQETGWNTDMPTNEGTYKLNNDVNLDNDWSFPNNNITTDIDGIAGGIINNK